MAQLTDHEAVCLEILQTDDLMAVGGHEEAIKGLAAKGYAAHKTGVWYTITDAGRAAFDAFENASMRGMIAEHNAAVRERSAPTIEGEIVEKDSAPCHR